MATLDFSYASSHGYAFDWTENTKFNDMRFNTPRPCRHGKNCYWKDPKTGDGCNFCHPGEEGTGRRLFPARKITREDGTEVWQPACVRLIGADFYERRRLRLFWPAWCERKGLPAPARKVPIEKVLEEDVCNSEGGAAAAAAPAPRTHMEKLLDEAVRKYQKQGGAKAKPAAAAAPQLDAATHAMIRACVESLRSILASKEASSEARLAAATETEANE
jgi:hypothetical protein